MIPLDQRVSYSPREAAEVSGIHIDTIRAAYRSGDLACYYRTPQRPVIFRDDLVAWIKAAPMERAS